MITQTHSQDVVDSALREFIATKKQAAAHIHPSYGRLLNEIERVLFSGGKRLRPHLVFIGYGSYDDSIAKVAAAHELLHTSLLVHDDIIDRDLVRHGQPTIQAAYQAIYTPHLQSEAERVHFSQSAAILAGDLLLSFAHELLAQAQLPQTGYQVSEALLSTGVLEVAGGELLDTEASFIPDEYEPMTVYRYKTAGYSLISPLLTGARLSPTGYDQTTLDTLTRCAENLGIAYQIQDDILGVFGDEATTGKSTSGDLREGKQTLLISEFKRLANPEDQEQFAASFGSPDASVAQLEELRRVLESSGALASTKAIAQTHLSRGLECISSLEDRALAQRLEQFFNSITARKA